MRKVVERSIAYADGWNALGRILLGPDHTEMENDEYKLKLDDGTEIEVDEATYNSYEPGDEYLG